MPNVNEVGYYEVRKQRLSVVYIWLCDSQLTNIIELTLNFRHAMLRKERREETFMQSRKIKLWKLLPFVINFRKRKYLIKWCNRLPFHKYQVVILVFFVSGSPRNFFFRFYENLNSLVLLKGHTARFYCHITEVTQGRSQEKVF